MLQDPEFLEFQLVNQNKTKYADILRLHTMLVKEPQLENDYDSFLHSFLLVLGPPFVHLPLLQNS